MMTGTEMPVIDEGTATQSDVGKEAAFAFPVPRLANLSVRDAG
jgi:hypothetical protein